MSSLRRREARLQISPAEIIAKSGLNDSDAQWLGTNVPAQWSERDRSACWEFLVELASRITVVPLDDALGTEKGALDSLYTLFKTWRDLLHRYGVDAPFFSIVSSAFVTWHLRPFTNRWHAGSEDFADPAIRGRFRLSLVPLQEVARRYALIFAAATGHELSEVWPERPAAADDGSANFRIAQSAIAKVRREVEREWPELARRRRARSRWPSFARLANDEFAIRAIDRIVRRVRQHQDDDIARDTPSRSDTVREAPSGLAGLALSGGGIRSAAFATGAVQVLAEKGLLPRFDYLSTVSGGGYLGAALSTYFARHEQSRNVVSTVAQDSASRGPDGESADPYGQGFPFARGKETEAIRNIRRNSSYLGSATEGGLKDGFAALVFGMLVHAAIYACTGLLLATTWWAVTKVANYELKTSWTVTGVSLALALIAALIRSGRLRRASIGYTSIIPAMLGFAAAVPFIFNERMYSSCVLALLVMACAAAVAGFLSTASPSPTAQRIAGMVLSSAGYIVVPLLMIVLIGMFYYEFFPAVAVSIEKHWVGYTELKVTAIGIAMGFVCIVGIGLLGIRVGPNATSLHRYYRISLSEAFNLASERERVLKLSQLRESQGPYPLVNASVAAFTFIRNDTSSADADASARSFLTAVDDARPGRRADVFLFSPLACGSHLTGFRSTLYVEKTNGDLDLATAMAVSAAAFSPTMGDKTLRQYRALMAVFNIRTGFWLRWRKPAPKRFYHSPCLRLIYALYMETMGSPNPKLDPELYLTDGGHTENLGVYPLLERRCELIVAVDGEEDHDYRFNGLSDALRLARVGMGFDVEFDVGQLASIAAGDQHYAIARIRYDGTREGYLIYIKSSLTRHALRNAFLYEYSKSVPVFPHESTADQFFTERQFEAYRALGERAAEQAFETASSIRSGSAT